MHLRITLALAALAFSSAAFAQEFIDSAHPDAFQVRYVSNLNLGDSYINITNTGTDATGTGKGSVTTGGNICVNVYAFDPAEELIACCSCTVTPNGLAKLSVTNDLISNTLTPATPTSVVVKLLATGVAGDSAKGARANSGMCDPGLSYDSTDLKSGMRAWGTSLHKNNAGNPPGSAAQAAIQITEGAFVFGGLSGDELGHISTFCGFIEANATAPANSGICSSCKTGGLFGAKQ